LGAASGREAIETITVPMLHPFRVLLLLRAGMIS